MGNAGVLDLFDHDDKVMSVGFKNLIERVAITLSIDELNAKSDLRDQIDQLTKFRNKGGEVYLMKPSESVQKLLVITKLNAIFQIIQQEDEVL